MYRCPTQLLSLLTAAALLGSLTAQAQDKATLDLLVQKGVISQADEDSVAKSAAVPVVAHDANIKKLQLEGDLQIQYDWLTTKDQASGHVNPTGTNEFMIRRAHIGLIGDMGNGWGGEILMDMAAGAQAPAAPQSAVGDAWNLFEKAVITDKIAPANGMLTIGYQKVMFGLEETTSANAVKPIERSLGSRYFDESYKGATSQRIGFANHHVGLFWDGKLPSITGLTYGAALTNGIQSSEQYTNTGGFNKFGYWLYAGYTNKIGGITYLTGLNFGLSQEGNSIPTGAGAQSNSVWGYNPYITLDYGNFEVSAEFEQAMVDNGRSNTAGTVSRADPYAFSITPSYKVTKQWEVVARYSRLNTDGRGTNISDIVRDAENVNNPAPGGLGQLFNSADQYYIGLNWYILGNSLKWSIGYEYTVFHDRGGPDGAIIYPLTGSGATVSGLRTRMQIMF